MHRLVRGPSGLSGPAAMNSGNSGDGRTGFGIKPDEPADPTLAPIERGEERHAYPSAAAVDEQRLCGHRYAGAVGEHTGELDPPVRTEGE